MSLDWLEPLRLFNLDKVVYNDRHLSELEVQDMSATPILDLDPSMDLPAVDIDAHSELSQRRLSDSAGFDTVQPGSIRSRPASRASAGESLIYAGLEMATTHLPPLSEGRGTPTIDCVLDARVKHSDNSKPVASNDADGLVPSPDLVTLDISQSRAASREEPKPTSRESGLDVEVPHKGLTDDIAW